jgi:hypothetical protein
MFPAKPGENRQYLAENRGDIRENRAKKVLNFPG